MKEEICNISARMIVNIASIKMKKNEIEEIIKKVQEEVNRREVLIAG